MKFYFPDSHDLVDPSFNFETERRDQTRSRHMAQCYAHEILTPPPYDGMLISKSVVDGNNKSVRYNFGQVQRLKRLGVKEFLRVTKLNRNGHPLEVMGDCGSFSYRDESEPPFSVEEIIDFYDTAGFDKGISLDHIILGYQKKDLLNTPPPEEWQNRFDLTLELAAKFFNQHKSGGYNFTPMGAAQGWSPDSYAQSVVALQKMGYEYIALGGLVPLKTQDILESLERINEIRKPSTKIHLLGVTRCEELSQFESYGVASFDSTSPLMKAFKDDKKNYHTLDSYYTAIRIPQVDANPQLKRAILAGKVDGGKARKLEQIALRTIIDFDKGKSSIQDTLLALGEYETFREGEYLHAKSDEQTLTDKPWRDCSCSICKEIGIHVVIFRGADRNRRRGFHNLHVLRNRISKHLPNL